MYYQLLLCAYDLWFVCVYRILIKALHQTKSRKVNQNSTREKDLFPSLFLKSQPGEPFSNNADVISLQLNNVPGSNTNNRINRFISVSDCYQKFLNERIGITFHLSNDCCVFRTAVSVIGINWQKSNSSVGFVLGP
mmetsp:Transcript_25832/g.26233  ORF Transcript_25832/g.26233 Transcript_25832/m.26233 type:complete len:136 (+) Transcript_25832:368-775(+)